MCQDSSDDGLTLVRSIKRDSLVRHVTWLDEVQVYCVYTVFKILKIHYIPQFSYLFKRRNVGLH
jgi:hypothetical protein